MRLRTVWFLFLVGSTAAKGAAVGNQFPRNPNEQEVLAEQEHRVLGLAVHDSEFGTIAPAIRSNCQEVQPPEPLATPNPPLDELAMNSTLTVSFIVGTDGQVVSALILDSAGSKQDRSALDFVQRWRYRPALCDGVPVDAEARVKFYLCHQATGCRAAGAPPQYLSEQPDVRDRRRLETPPSFGVTR